MEIEIHQVNELTIDVRLKRKKSVPWHYHLSSIGMLFVVTNCDSWVVFSIKIDSYKTIAPLQYGICVSIIPLKPDLSQTVPI